MSDNELPQAANQKAIEEKLEELLGEPPQEATELSSDVYRIKPVKGKLGPEAIEHSAELAKEAMPKIVVSAPIGDTKTAPKPQQVILEKSAASSSKINKLPDQGITHKLKGIFNKK